MAKIDEFSLEVSPNILKEQVKKIGITRPQELLIEPLECNLLCNHVSNLDGVLKITNEHKKWIKTNKNRRATNLPISKVCTFCGETGYLRFSCNMKMNVSDNNVRMLKHMWVAKVDEREEPKAYWVPVSNN